MKVNNQTKDKNLLALLDFGNQINSNLNLDFILKNLLYTLFAKFLITKGSVLLYDENGNLIIKEIKGQKIESESEITDLEKFSAENKMPNIFSLLFNEKKLGYVLLGNKFGDANFNEDDKSFVETVLSIASTAIANSQNFEKLSLTNRMLDAKINQLNSLFDLAKEFTGIFDIENATKIFLFSIIGQFLVSKYAVISCDQNVGIIVSKFDNSILKQIFDDKNYCFENPLITSDLKIPEAEILENIGVELIVPMQYKNETRGLILLGKRADGKSYTQSDIEFIYSVGSLGIISFENSRLFNEYLEKQKIEKDLELARKIQRNLLPREIPQSDIFEIDAVNISARQVGGDYFDVIKLKNGKILIVIADVSGKGMQAALLMSNIQAVIKTLTKFDYPIAQATNLLNDLIAENTTDGSFITMFWALLDGESGTIEYVNAGHNPPLLISNNTLHKLTKGGMILGVMKTIVPYVSEKIKLGKKDKIILFTDGITEAMDVNSSEYSDERLEKLVISVNNKSSNELLNIILEDVKKHTAGAEQSDDITLMVVTKIT